LAPRRESLTDSSSGLSHSDCGEEEAKKLFDGESGHSTPADQQSKYIPSSEPVEHHRSIKSSNVADGHTWWSYVWHEMRNNPSFGHDDDQTRIALDDTTMSVDDTGERDSTTAHLHGVIRSQAIELTALRQVHFLSTDTTLFL
jgi:hypothetical protein